MTRSEIFDSFVKIAEDKGLVSKAEDTPSYQQLAAPKESAKLKKYKKDPAARAGSDDISTIESLYGVRPEGSKDYEYNIMEVAHPKSVVIGPSYDKLNALVENNNERSNIMCNITEKPVTGNITNHKYAEKELMMELIRIANDMDNFGNDELRVIADTCIEDLKKKAFDFSDVGNWLQDKSQDIWNIGKGIGAGATLGMLAGAAIGTIIEPGGGTLVGAKIGGTLGAESGFLAAFFGKTPPIIQSVATNAKETLSQIEDVRKQIPKEDAEFKFLTDFQTALNNLADTSIRYNQNLSAAKSSEQTDHSDVSEVGEISKELVIQINIIKQFAAKFNQKAASEFYNQWIKKNKLTDFVVYRFIDDDVQDVQSSIRSLLKAITQFDDIAKQLNAQMHSEAAKQKVAPKEDAEDAEQSEQSQTEQSQTEGDEESSLSDKLFDMIGYKPGKKEQDFFKSLK